MAAPFRIPKPSGTDAFKEYLERLLKLIPGEVVGLYMVGSGFIPEAQSIGLLIWSILCLVGVFFVRRYGTADPQAGQGPQNVPVAISCIAFAVWIYWLGGPFEQFGFHVPWIGSLLVLVVSFIVPYFYKPK